MNSDSIELTPEQKAILADLARHSGRTWESLLAEAIEAVKEAHKHDQVDDEEGESVYDAAMRLGLIGCVEGPEDLATNPAYMEGFGTR